jgi:hypothetical protein
MNKVAFAKCIVLSLLFLIPTRTQAQQTFRTTSSGSIIGYLEYLPQDYNTNSDKYPVVIFLHGADERGASSTDPAVLQTTINLAAKLGPPQHVINGVQFPFILITPQLKTSYGSWPSSYVQEVIDHCKTYLRIDERRIHVTGLSMGGHGTWTCIQDLPKLFASGAPVCGANNSISKACGIASENVGVWAFHGDADPIVSYTKTTSMVNAINACVPAPNPAAKATIYAGIQHNAWYRAYFTTNSYHTPNYYQWLMLQTKIKKGGNSVPLANAGADKTISTSTTSITGSGTDSDGTIASYKWSQLQGPNASSLSGTTSATLNASGLITGTYVYKLQVTDNAGLTDTDFIKVTVSTTGANVSPVANAGADKVITLPTTSTSFTGSATDSDGTISTYSWTKISGGAATLAGATTSTLSLTGLAGGAYVFRLTVTDNKGATNSDDVNLIVNALPTVSAGSDKSITLPTNSVAIQGTASDPDGSISTYTWAMTTGTAGTLSGTSSSTLNASGLVQGSYVFRLTVKDDRGASSSDDVKVTVLANTSTNVAPVADAGADRNISLPTNSLAITATGTDSDGTIASYAWTKVSGGTATLSGATTNTLSLSGLVAGSYVFRVTVTDNGGSTDYDDVTVFVNNPPVVSTGADFSITLPTNSTSIQATASDTDGSISTYLWKMTTGTGGTLSGTTTSKLTATGLVEGPYVFRLTVTDNLGASKFDDVKVTVLADPNPNTAPVAEAGDDQAISLPTNSITFTGTGSDTDGTIATYSWTKISGGTATLNGITTPTLLVTDLVAGTYVFRMTVTDNEGSSDFDDVSVTVNSPPSVSVGADYIITLPSNSTAVQGIASDADGTIVSYSWKMTTGTIATLSGTNTSLLTATGLVEGPYVFRLTVTDNFGATKFDDVKITVKTSAEGSTATNQAPVAEAGADRLITLPSNSITITGTGTDADGTISTYTWSKISGGSATLVDITTPTMTASGLTWGTYIFRLSVTDNKGASAFDDVTVIVNSPPVASVGADFKITLPTNSLSVQGTASDVDGTIVSYSWKMTTGTVGTLSGINTSKLTATGLVEGPYVFRMTVKDDRGASKFDDVKIYVLADPNPNNLPVADAGADNLISLPTNSVSLTGSGSDSDGTISSYTWSKVSGGTATLSGASTAALSCTNLEAGAYVFRLTVTDNRGGIDSDDVSVIVNSPPMVSVGADFSLTLPTNSLSVQGTASDTDGTIVSYSWKMTTGTIATLSGITTSKLTATDLVEGSYVFRLTVKDNFGASKFDDVKIIVKPATTIAASSVVDAELESLSADQEEVEIERALSHESNLFWKNKKVLIYDATGKEIFSGRWSSSDFSKYISAGKLYLYNILSEEKKTQRGRFMIIE